MSREPLRAAARRRERDLIAARPPAAAPPATEVAARPPGTGVNPSADLGALEDDVDELLAENGALRRMLLGWVTSHRIGKDAAKYRQRGAAPQACGNCVMYHDRSCDLVRGEIDPEYVCDRWEPDA